MAQCVYILLNSPKRCSESDTGGKSNEATEKYIRDISYIIYYQSVMLMTMMRVTTDILHNKIK